MTADTNVGFPRERCALRAGAGPRHRRSRGDRRQLASARARGRARRLGRGRQGQRLRARAREGRPARCNPPARGLFRRPGRRGPRARAASRRKRRIYVLNGLEKAADPADYARNGPHAVIGSAEELERWSSKRRATATSSPSALHLDTGMNRLGFESLGGAQGRDGRCGRRSGADLLMSHFVSSETPGDRQCAADRALRRGARRVSGSPRFARQFLRPVLGRGRSTISPPRLRALRRQSDARPPAIRCAPRVTLDVAIQQTRWIEAGETCGYNGQWTARRRTRLATLLAGYADGLPRGAGAIDANPAPTSSSPAAAARWSGACRWIFASPT